MLWLFDFFQLDINKLDKKVRNVTAKAKLLTSNSTCDKNPLEQPTFFFLFTSRITQATVN